MAGVTVGGATASRVVRTVAGAANSDVEIWVIDSGVGTALESVTSAVVVVSFRSASIASSIVVFKGTGYGTTADATNTGTSSATAGIRPTALLLLRSSTNRAHPAPSAM